MPLIFQRDRGHEIGTGVTAGHAGRGQGLENMTIENAAERETVIVTVTGSANVKKTGQQSNSKIIVTQGFLSIRV